MPFDEHENTRIEKLNITALERQDFKQIFWFISKLRDLFVKQKEANLENPRICSWKLYKVYSRFLEKLEIPNVTELNLF